MRKQHELRHQSVGFAVYCLGLCLLAAKTVLGTTSRTDDQKEKCDNGWSPPENSNNDNDCQPIIAALSTAPGLTSLPHVSNNQDKLTQEARLSRDQILGLYSDPHLRFPDLIKFNSGGCNDSLWQQKLVFN